ncbi:MAG: hypothetical protein HN348_16575 [Proteobacteria bacterium]|nr:hypothetical protein [Pseudomonadota bacterium]
MNKTSLIVDFFEHLQGMDPIIRAVAPTQTVQVLFTLRGDGVARTIRLDLTKNPFDVIVDGQDRMAEVMVIMSSEVMHAILTRKMTAGEAYGQRELLLRGSIADLVRVLPLIDFAPEMYIDHMQFRENKMARFKDSETSLESRRRDRVLETIVESAAWGMGFAVGRFRRRFPRGPTVLEILMAMSDGLQSANNEQARA